MNIKNAPRILLVFALALGLIAPFSLTHNASAAPPLSGAIFTTDSTCTGVNINIFGSKDDVYLDGGPAHPGAAGLPDGEYYCQVTEPNGTLLGTSLGTADETPIVVSGGEFVQCYQLSAILRKASDGSAGYDDTSNPGGECKVWISSVGTFDNDSSKTDNFKVRGDTPDPPRSTLNVIKFYDADADGIHDAGEPDIIGWKVRIQDGIDFIRFTPVLIVLDPDDYTITEFAPIEPNWVGTTANPVLITLAANDNATVEFGNVCLGGGGGHTLGFWSNKNGQATMNDGGSLAQELALLSGLNLRNANGSNFDPGNYSQFRNWLLGASATNMAYMLSAQLSAMALNVEAGFVSGGALVHAPALLPFAPAGLNALGFISISDLMTAANTELGLHGNTVSGGLQDAFRAYQEALKNALDAANNNQNFVQGTPCPFTFE
jgi:hypothetical protein